MCQYRINPFLTRSLIQEVCCDSQSSLFDVDGLSYLLILMIGNPIVWQLVPTPDAVKKLPGRKSTDNFFFAAGAWLPTPKWQGSASHELVFLAADLPPLGIKSFYVQSTLSDESSVSIQREHLNGKTNNSSGDHTISNEVFHNEALFIAIYIAIKILDHTNIHCDSLENYDYC